MPNMRSALAHAARSGRNRSASLSTVPPTQGHEDYLPELAAIAASILYRSPHLSLEGRPVYILNAAAFPDAFEVDYDTLLAYVLARLPGEEELIAGTDYEVVFFAGGTPDNATQEKKQGPNTGWYLQAYHVLSRALRKKLQRLYIVHPRTWVRVLISVFGTIVSPKFRRKIVHVNSLSQLALHIAIEKLLIPPSAYLQDRKVSSEVYAPFVTGRRAFGVNHPFPKNISTGESRLPRVLRETTSFVLMPSNVITEGLFRIPPHNILSSILKEAYDRGQQFIVWKEGDATFVAPGMDQALLNEVRLEDAYGVHLAASLIKTWYRELREPIFPESSYSALRERYSDPGTEVTPEDVVDLILPASASSPLTQTAREILARHLLPLLSVIASHETENKMNAENLAICFSMCLVCGSDQMQDAKMSTVVKRILHAAINMWPQLRSGMGFDEGAFFKDIQPPSDSREYEDPLEDAKPPQHAADGADDEMPDGHRIVMADSDSPRSLSPEGPPPALPPRRSRASSWRKALKTQIPDIDLSSLPKPKIELPMIPKRKPAPHHEAEPPSPYRDDATVFDQTSAPPPPRYSALFDRNGRSVQVEESPATDVPPDSFGSPRRVPNLDREKKAASYPDPLEHNPMEHNPMAAVPKRKAVSGSGSGSRKSSPEATPAAPLSRQPSDSNSSHASNALLARMAAQQAANNLAHRITVAAPERKDSTAGEINSAPADLAKFPEAATPNSANDNGVFRKPSRPASANRQLQQPSTIQFLAKPVIQPHHASTFPMASNSGSSRHLSPPHVPKPRTPSPGLLQRMSSMENTHSQRASSAGSGGLQPNKLNLKKTSVDDLRRLYEERVTTAEGLAGVVRRKTTHR
ncbi:hypothetical protein DOTSEDRAFT_72126 [Lecanosticta acicola]|uniref:Uncharacterized protein n=1 Tax=Lecanosticta acicola TaxID=111012 RepID=A0AAI9EED9_9PEZI|nr:hypothetical protein DOTSEDRAFT_72126 [Lecanosticta acicola]